MGASETCDAVRNKNDDLEVATWSGSHLAPAAVKQHPTLIFHSPSYVPAVSSPTATPILAYLFMSPPTPPHAAN